MGQIERWDELVDEIKLLHLIYHRNKNQHRNQHWWRYFLILLSNLKNLTVGLTTVDKIMSKKIIEKCYREFHGIIALGQFINLGFVLIGCISRIGVILSDGYEVRQPKKPIEVKIRQVDINEDMGEEIEPEELTTNPEKESKIPRESKISKASKKKSKKKINDIFKKKKKSSIDKLFG